MCLFIFVRMRRGDKIRCCEKTVTSCVLPGYRKTSLLCTHQVILEFKGPDYIIGLEDTPGVSSEILVIVLLATTRDCVKTRLASNLKRGRHEKKDTEQTTRYVLQRDAYMDEDTKRQ